MNAHIALVARGLAAVRIHSAMSYSWFGQRNPQLPKRVRLAISPADAREYLLYALQQQLYHHFYCPGSAVPATVADFDGRRALARTEFVGELSAANAGTGSSDRGWWVHAVDGDLIVVERQGLRLWLDLDQLCETGGNEPEPGSLVSIRLPKELLKRSPGFYLSLGNEGLAPRRTDPLVRLYWNVVADAAPRLVASMTVQLNRAHIPFRLKVIDDPDGYSRCDAAVLYVPKRCYAAVVDVATDVSRGLRASLLAGTPAFTKPLAPGVALAEDPGTGDSFGMHRCRLFAEGIVRAYEEKRRSPTARLGSVIDSFAAAGINCDEPFLNPGSTDTYPVFDGEALTR